MNESPATVAPSIKDRTLAVRTVPLRKKPNGINGAQDVPKGYDPYPYNPSKAKQMLAAAGYLAGGPVPTRGGLELGGGVVCYRAYPCADGWVTLGALEPRFWAVWCHGVGADELIPHQFDPAGSPAHRVVEEIFRGRTRAAWEARRIPGLVRRETSSPPRHNRTTCRRA